MRRKSLLQHPYSAEYIEIQLGSIGRSQYHKYEILLNAIHTLLNDTIIECKWQLYRKYYHGLLAPSVTC